eukprot:m.85443 g.85443  ORF g.85443 m.85443 type:complete len:740 (+) comp13013_c0_seq1:403-2622(+)
MNMLTKLGIPILLLVFTSNVNAFKSLADLRRSNNLESKHAAGEKTLHKKDTILTSSQPPDVGKSNDAPRTTVDINKSQKASQDTPKLSKPSMEKKPPRKNNLHYNKPPESEREKEQILTPGENDLNYNREVIGVLVLLALFLLSYVRPRTAISSFHLECLSCISRIDKTTQGQTTSEISKEALTALLNEIEVLLEAASAEKDDTGNHDELVSSLQARHDWLVTAAVRQGYSDVATRAAGIHIIDGGLRKFVKDVIPAHEAHARAHQELKALCNNPGSAGQVNNTKAIAFAREHGLLHVPEAKALLEKQDKQELATEYQAILPQQILALEDGNSGSAMVGDLRAKENDGGDETMVVDSQVHFETLSASSSHTRSSTGGDFKSQIETFAHEIVDIHNSVYSVHKNKNGWSNEKNTTGTGSRNVALNATEKAIEVWTTLMINTEKRRTDVMKLVARKSELAEKREIELQKCRREEERAQREYEKDLQDAEERLALDIRKQREKAYKKLRNSRETLKTELRALVYFSLKVAAGLVLLVVAAKILPQLTEGRVKTCDDLQDVGDSYFGFIAFPSLMQRASMQLCETVSSVQRVIWYGFGLLVMCTNAFLTHFGGQRTGNIFLLVCGYYLLKDSFKSLVSKGYITSLVVIAPCLLAFLIYYVIDNYDSKRFQKAMKGVTSNPLKETDKDQRRSAIVDIGFLDPDVVFAWGPVIGYHDVRPLCVEFVLPLVISSVSVSLGMYFFNH